MCVASSKLEQPGSNLVMTPRGSRVVSISGGMQAKGSLLAKIDLVPCGTLLRQLIVHTLGALYLP